MAGSGLAGAGSFAAEARIQEAAKPADCQHCIELVVVGIAHRPYVVSAAPQLGECVERALADAGVAEHPIEVSRRKSIGGCWADRPLEKFGCVIPPGSQPLTVQVERSTEYLRCGTGVALPYREPDARHW